MNDTDIKIVESPLSCRINADGTYVDIQIYLDEGNGWILEIVDELNGSTVWDETFKTDQAALDEAKRAIKADGIQSFMKDPAPRLN